MEIVLLNKIYIVNHVHKYYSDPEDPHKKYLDLKGIGNFYSLKEAEQAIEKCKTLKGFKEHPDGFTITEFTMDSIYNKQINLLLSDKIKEKKPKKIFVLYYALEDEDSDENVMILGVFTCKKTAVNARKALLCSDFLENSSDNLQIFEEYTNKINWEEGFITWEDSIKTIASEIKRNKTCE